MASPIMAVDSRLHEFYAPATPNERKREIELELITFKNQPDAWKTCLSAISITMPQAFEQNQFLWFFCTSTVEYAITRRWMQLTSADRSLLRDTLWHTYANMSQAAKRQRDTYAQLIALLGKRQFPDEDPNYMNNCVTLIRTNFSLGICLLRTTSEEVTSNREDVTTDRKQYYHSCISICLPDVMDLLTNYLVIALSHINGKDIHSIHNSHMDYNLLTSLPNGNQLSCCILELLICIQHLVSWISTDLLTEQFLISIFELSQWRPFHQNISLCGLSILNELLYLQKPLPHPYHFLSGINCLLEQYHSFSKQECEMYLDKFRELVRLYVNKYWCRMIQRPDILHSFVKSLHAWTLYRNGAYDFTEKLEIWTPIIKALYMQHNTFFNCNDFIDQLVPEIIQRTQFECNKTEMELLDNEHTDDNSPSELQQYIIQCIECIALIAESRPTAVLNEIFPHWIRCYTYLQCLQSDLDYGKTVELMRKFKSQFFADHTRDFATICQMVVRVAPLFPMDDVDNSLAQVEFKTRINKIAENLLNILRFFTSSKLIALNFDGSTFQTDFNYLYAQILMAIRSILPLVHNLKTQEKMTQLFSYLGVIFETNNSGVNNSRCATIVYMAASQLLLYISTVIRPNFLLDIPHIYNLMHIDPCMFHLPRQSLANIYCSVIGYLVMPWPNTTEQEQNYQHRHLMVRDYVQQLSKNFLQLNSNNAAETKVATITENLLLTLSLVIAFFKDSSNAIKDILINNFKPIIHQALLIYNWFGQSNTTVAATVAEFSLSVLRTLPLQLGVSFTKEMIHLFITVTSREQMTVSRVGAIEKIVQMLQLIVEQPGSEFLAMIASILDFTFDHIMPLLQNEHNLSNFSDITSAVYDLLDKILTHKWQYFYKSHVQPNGSALSTILNGDSSNDGANTNASDNLHPEHFMAIMNAYGQILVTGNDPNIVRIVLNSMQNVNERWRLYQRALFKENLLASFQSALIKVLLSGEGALHFEILANTLFTMSQVDPLKMRENFAQAGLPINLKMIDEICMTTDIPTFSQKLSQLIRDAHCVHLTQI